MGLKEQLDKLNEEIVSGKVGPGKSDPIVPPNEAELSKNLNRIQLLMVQRDLLITTLEQMQRHIQKVLTTVGEKSEKQ